MTSWSTVTLAGRCPQCGDPYTEVGIITSNGQRLCQTYVFLHSAMRACQSDYLPLPSMTGPTGAANAVDADANPAADHAPYTDLVDAADTTGAPPSAPNKKKKLKA